MTEPPPGILEELYGLAPEEFTDRRNAIARELKQGGDRHAASAVATLRKPALHIWAVNRLARERALAVTRLLSAAANLAEAQQLALAGDEGGKGRLRQDSGEYQRSLDLAVREAGGLLRDAGRVTSEETARRVREILAGAALGDAASRARLASGTLGEAPTPAAAFGFAWSGDVAPRIEAQRRSAPRPAVTARPAVVVSSNPAPGAPDRRVRHQQRIEARHTAETTAATAKRLAEVARRARRRASVAAAAAASAEAEATEAEVRAEAANAEAERAGAHYEGLQATD